jgi:hypothetical protein
VTRTEALAKAITWAKRAEAAEARRLDCTTRARDAASNFNLQAHAQGLFNAASDAVSDRQTSIDMAHVWAAIASSTPEEPTP